MGSAARQVRTETPVPQRYPALGLLINELAGLVAADRYVSGPRPGLSRRESPLEAPPGEKRRRWQVLVRRPRDSRLLDRPAL
jgi:hypothetical protein